MDVLLQARSARTAAARQVIAERNPAAEAPAEQVVLDAATPGAMASGGGRGGC
jgi:hypothetical protein